MNAEDVALYLRTHPDFLNEHHELFTQLTVPHPQHGGQAISLAERQLHALRDKIRQLEVKLAELIRFGEENDDISTKVHRLAVALLHAGSVAAVRQGLINALTDYSAVYSGGILTVAVNYPTSKLNQVMPFLVLPGIGTVPNLPAQLQVTSSMQF